ncbi:substrate-binding domain-containing protein [Niabella ginsengisoli]|uniref:Substrate-binding domain-containing protein n=1 Tax=Niabella ginsengisoli TaxID=522298 RepID=A0ABS9SQG2_9BACT|nr:substrate-binding domain-containing protein [Niabella ginsengisoli]
MISYKTKLNHLNDRTKGYTQALTDHKIAADKTLIKKVSLNHDATEITAAVKSLLSTPSVDAILFASNRIALHALKYIQQTGIKIPDQVELIGFDESEVFDFFQPQLSYVKQPMHQLGQTATELLMDIITQNKKEQLVFVPSELIKRGSTSSASGRTSSQPSPKERE